MRQRNSMSKLCNICKTIVTGRASRFKNKRGEYKENIFCSDNCRQVWEQTKGVKYLQLRDKQWCVENYIKLRSKNKIARLLGCSIATLNRYFAQHDIFRKTIMINPLSKAAREVVLGTVMGDGSLVKQPKHLNWDKNKTKQRLVETRHYHLQIRHSAKQWEYVKWLYEHLKPICGSFPKERRYYSKQRKKWYSSVDLVTRTLSFFTRLRKLYYPKGIKIVTRKMLNQFTPLSLAVWFMDDGTSAKRQIWLATNCFPYEQQQIIQQYLREVWKVESHITKERNQYKIAIYGANTKIFCNIIAPHIIPSMKYKIEKI